MHLGRERPRPGRAWGEVGGSKEEVAHAPVVSLLGCDSGADSMPAAQSAAGVRLEAVDWLEHRASFVLHKAKRAVGSASAACLGRGTVLPSFGSPTLFPLPRSRHRHPGEGQGGRVTVRPTGATADPGTGGAAAL